MGRVSQSSKYTRSEGVRLTLGKPYPAHQRSVSSHGDDFCFDPTAGHQGLTASVISRPVSRNVAAPDGTPADGPGRDSRVTRQAPRVHPSTPHSHVQQQRMDHYEVVFRKSRIWK